MKKLLIFFGILLLPYLLNAQIISRFAGGGTSAPGDNGPATAAIIFNPVGGCFDSDGNYYVTSCLGSNRIRKINASGLITTVAGNGVLGYNGDGIAATSAKLNLPNTVIIDTVGNLFICEGQGGRVRKIDKATGIITTIAGNGTFGFGGDGGPATASVLNDPLGICFDKFGNLYIADYQNYRIRKINTSGIITTIAGNGNVGYGGDGSRADTVTIGGIAGICSDSSGNIYFGDNVNGRVFKISTSGFISTVAGTSTGYLYNGDDIPATTANISPNQIKIDESGYLYIAEVNNWRVRKVDAAGIIHTVAGNGINTSSGDNGPATAASIGKPNGLAFDACGNLYIPEASNPGRIRKVTFNPHTTASAAISSVSTAPIGTVVTVTATLSGAGSAYSIKWFNRGTLFATTTVPTVIYTKAAGADTITARIVPAMAACYDSSTSAQHIVAVGTNGVNDITAGDIGVISIYPNPAHSSLIVSADAVASSIVITDLAGRVLLTKTNNTTTALVDISQLAAGVYFVKVNGLYVQKLIKE